MLIPGRFTRPGMILIEDLKRVDWCAVLQEFMAKAGTHRAPRGMISIELSMTLDLVTGARTRVTSLIPPDTHVAEICWVTP